MKKTEEDHSDLFKHLKIWQTKHREKQGKYPVIFLTLKEINHRSWDAAYQKLQLLVSLEFRRHKILLTALLPGSLDAPVLDEGEKKQFQAFLDRESDPALLENSLKLLSLWLSRYYQKQVYVFIDEYDAPVHSAHLHGYYDEMISFMRSWLGDGLKDNPSLQQAVITGILRTAKEGIFSGLDHFGCHTLLGRRFSDKFGLLEQEVSSLLQEQEIPHTIEEVRAWYNGYKIGSHSIYNPWSILQYIENQGQLRPYWLNTSDNALIKKLLLQGNKAIKTDLESILQGGVITKPIEESVTFPFLQEDENTLWALLFFSGYLTLDKEPFYNGTDLICLLKAPNQEVLSLYKKIIQDWLKQGLSSSEDISLLLNSLLTGDVCTFSKMFAQLLLNSMSYYDISSNEPERVYHAFVLGLLVSLQATHEVKSNKESGYGRYDVCLIPKDPNALGIIMEFKKVDEKEESLESCAEKALLQIEEKKYATELQSRGIRRFLCLGVAFLQKQVYIKERRLSS